MGLRVSFQFGALGGTIEIHYSTFLEEYENPYSEKPLPPFSEKELGLEVELRKISNGKISFFSLIIKLYPFLHSKNLKNLHISHFNEIFMYRNN